ncbi:dehydrogenase [Peribacillus simplex]|uniref:Dehydrogenase n=1 Tax=Peribacillus simplex TaxID=1478 RepID=A0A109MWQ2_9BACI|nr:Gfo/Idh/MocA family oxidoreductase [Peribacillus simplex]KWW17298.1 dehydrogenase [Peribacillus simplex]
MRDKLINVGIIGGSLNNQWASKTHIPVLKESPFFQIMAIGTSKMETAKKSATMINAPLAFTSHKELAKSKDVDLVVVSIKVPFHYEASIAAIKENKHLYCEWPLGIDTIQAKDLANLADQANIHHAIGLQARQSPEVNYLKQAIKQGEIGKVLSCTMQVATQGKGKITDQRSDYLLKKENGANLLTINGGHSLDVLCYILSDFKELSATMNVNYTEAIIQETGIKTPKNTADQILIHGTLIDGISASVHIQGGVYPNFHLEIRGEEGVFRLKQHDSSGHVQFGNLKIEKITHSTFTTFTETDDVYLEEIKLPYKENSSPAGYVKHAYNLLARDILENKSQIPNFNDAVKLHQLIDAIQDSAETGKKIVLMNE